MLAAAAAPVLRNLRLFIVSSFRIVIVAILDRTAARLGGEGPVR
jgi:hypothetical protein